MKMLEGQTLTGQLFSWKKGINFNWTELPNVSVRPSDGGWKVVTLNTKEPLLVDDDLTAKEFFYEYLLRAYAEHLVFVSNNHYLIEVFMRKMNFAKNAQKPTVDVDRLVKELSKKTHARYTVSRVFANVEGYGRKLRSISLFGDDLVDVSAFQELLPILVSSRAELRNIKRRVNVLSVDIEGAIDFYYRNPLSLKLMLDALSFLSTGEVRQEPNEEPLKIEKMDPFISW